MTRWHPISSASLSSLYLSLIANHQITSFPSLLSPPNPHLGAANCSNNDGGAAAFDGKGAIHHHFSASSPTRPYSSIAAVALPVHPSLYPDFCPRFHIY
ncbi:hypothetical protein AAHA92_12066 [Salvia divinorum]|uniref:Uncharacterized protein n=1 Tax=Salvia divinorum TaxID=28513 RepID=A0ABD1HLN4_SALDI